MIAIIPSKKCRTVKRRIAHEVTVDEASIPATTSSPRNGITLAKFKMTNAAQYDMFPDTTTYPVNATPSPRRKITAPRNQIMHLVGLTILEVVRVLPACMNVAKITKFAPSICSRRRNQTKLP
jgi:hypothetical protein